MSLQVVVLAGGIGKRIAPLGTTKPKAMFEIMGKPIVQHVLEGILDSGISVEDITLVIGPGENSIRDYLGTGEQLGVQLHYAVQEKPLGQANALLSARSRIRGDFLVTNANDIYEPTLIMDLLRFARAGLHDVALVGQPVDNPSKFGIMSFDTKGRLIGVVEKPSKDNAPSSMAVVGMYFFSSKIWKAIDKTVVGTTDDQLERAYQSLISDGRGGYIKYDGAFATYKYPWDLLAINDLLLHQKGRQSISVTAAISPTAILDGPVIVEDGAKILDFAVIRGPAYVGRNSTIGNNSLIRGNASVGHRSVVGYGTEVKHSILGNDCWTHKNFIGDSIIGDNCSFGAGTITANLRFDEKPVKVRIGDRRESTGLKHFGVVMADNCRTGCNVVLLPGKKIGPNSVVGPGVVLDDDLPEQTMALLSSGAYEHQANNISVERRMPPDRR